MKSSETTLHHSQCEHLMPSFVNGNLSLEQQRQVQEHVARCDSCFRLLQETQAIADGVKATPPELDELLTTARLEKNLQNVLARTEGNTDQGRKSTGKGRVIKLPDWRRSWRNTPTLSKTLVWSQAACLMLVVGLFTVTERVSSPDAPKEYVTLSDPTEKLADTREDYQVYRIVFHPASTEADIRQLMNSVGTQIISGPSVSGVYTISSLKKAPQQVLILKSLRASPWVKYAEPSLAAPENPSATDRKQP